MARIPTGNDDKGCPVVCGPGGLLLGTLELSRLLNGVHNENRDLMFLLSGKRPSSPGFGAFLPLGKSLSVDMHQQGGNVSGGESEEVRVFIL